MTLEEELGHVKGQDTDDSQEGEQLPLTSGNMDDITVINEDGTEDGIDSEAEALEPKSVSMDDRVLPFGSDSIDDKMSIENLESQEESKKQSFDRKCGLIVMLLLSVIVFGAVASLIIIKSGSKQVERTIFSFGAYFGDHMVFQRAPSQAVVWGYSSMSSDNTSLLLLLEGDGSRQELTTEVSTDGIWKFVLQPVNSRGPFTVYVSTVGREPHTLELKDVLFGDVWLCAGQNSMQQSLDQKKTSEADLSDFSDLSNIRLLSLWPGKSNHPKIDISQPEIRWTLPSRESLLGIKGGDVNYQIAFSGLCWLYGMELHKKLHYPIGLVSAAYSFSSIEDWASPVALDNCNVSVDYLTSTVHNALVNPLFSVSLYGIIWYQGASDAPEWSSDYHCILVEMIKTWRRNWMSHTGVTTELPVGIVQLGPNEEEKKYGYPQLRWQQTADFGYIPNPLLGRSFMAVTIDLPVMNSSIDRANKQIAKRLVKGSMVEAYQEKGLVFQGPWPTSYIAFKENKSMILNIGADNLEIRKKHGFEVCCSNSSNQTPVTISFNKVRDVPGTEWATAPIVSHTLSSVTLSWQNQKACENKSMVGLRFLWSEKPCQYLSCPVYDDQTGLPMAPYIRLHLVDDGYYHVLPKDQTFLL